MVAVDVGTENGDRTVLIDDPGPDACGGSTYAVKYLYFVSSQAKSGHYRRHGTDYFRLQPSLAAPSCREQVVTPLPCPETGAPRHFISDPKNFDLVSRKQTSSWVR